MKLFSKSYFQLKRSSVNNDLQSHVLVIDRIIHPQDLLEPNNIRSITFRKSERNKFNYNLHTYFPIQNEQNFLQQFILTILVSMMPQSIPEAFGYNKPLFIADKVAKFYLTEFKRLLTSMISLLGNDAVVRKNIYAYERFRDTREEIELNRRNIEA